MNDTTRRFLEAVLERVPESRIVEVRLFPAIRQGGIESGIAVLAVDPEPPLALPQASELDTADGAGASYWVPDQDTGPGETPVSLTAVDDDASDDDFSPTVVPARRDSMSGELEDDVVDAHAHAHEERTPEREITLEGIANAPTLELPVVDPSDQRTREIPIDLTAAASDSAPPADEDDEIALGDILALPPRTVPTPGPERLAILCARYKLIVKGADRGKWDIEIVHQADAPLDTLDLVIKGVVRRSGDDVVPERFSRQSLRELLDAPAWATDT